MGRLSVSILTLLDASSIKSIALSGKYLSVTYRLLSLEAAINAVSSIVTLWCASYFGRSAFKILIVFSILGSSRKTG